MYTLSSDSAAVIRDADKAHIATDPANTDYATYLAWLAEGNTATPYTVPSLTPEQQQAALTKDVQLVLDAKAQSYGYDSIATAVTYADEAAVPKFQAEGQALRAWRSEVWAAAYAYLAEVEAGKKAYPTAAELPGLLPTYEAPTTP